MIRRRIMPSVTEKEKPKGFDDFELRLGDVMRGERATLGKSLLDVQRELKIKASYVAAIENADPSAFETPGFIAGYVRSYARYLGMDPDWAFHAFCTEAGFETSHGLSKEASAAKPARIQPRSGTGDPLANPNATFVPRAESILAGIEPGALGSVALLLALIGVIGFGGWSVLQEIQRVDFAPVDQSPALADTGQGTDGLLIADAARPSAEAFERLYRPEALETPVLVARDGPIATIDPGEVGVLADAGATQRRATPAPVAEPNLTRPTQVLAQSDPTVRVYSVRASWVRIESPDGAVLYEAIMEPGDEFVVPTGDGIPILRTGNAGGVYFQIGDQTYGPAGQGGSVVKNVALSPQNVVESYPVAELQ